MEILQQYAIPVIVGVCLCVGQIIKGFGFIKDNLLQLILAMLGLGLNVWMQGAISPEIILGGLASGLAACGTYDLVKTLFNKE